MIVTGILMDIGNGKIRKIKMNELLKYKEKYYKLNRKRNLLDEEALVAVQKNGWALQFVKEQTPAICLVAVKQNGYALQYVKEQTPDICLAAVQQNGYALQFVKQQTPDLCLAAVQQDGYALQFVKEQTRALCLAAVQQDGWALKYVNEKIFEEIERPSCKHFCNCPYRRNN